MEACMLCQPLTEKRLQKLSFPLYVQDKEDGARIIIVKRGGHAHLMTRKFNEYVALRTLKQTIENLPTDNIVLDGELLFGNLDRETSNGLANKALHDNLTPTEEKSARLVLWDIISIEDYDRGFSLTPYATRLDFLDEVVENAENIKVIFTEVVENEAQIYAKFGYALSQGKEGIIVKNPNGYYEFARSSNCLKMKEEKTCDLRVIEMVEGQGKNSCMMGSLHCVSDDGKIDVWVGSGFTDTDRIAWWDNFNPNMDSIIVEVKYNKLIKDKSKPNIYSLFLPVFSTIREDKSTTSTIEELLSV